MMQLLVIEDVPMLTLCHLHLAMNSRERSADLVFLTGLLSENSCDQLQVMPTLLHVTSLQIISFHMQLHLFSF